MKKVLIIEDDPIVAHIYRTRLEKEGYSVEIAADGQSGFYRIHEFEPDAVLLDLMLPKMNGVEILKKIRAESRYAKTPVIVFTNAYVPNMINESFLAGATLVFNKATLTPRQIIDSLHGAIYSAIPADGTPPKANHPSAPAPTPLPQPGHFLPTAVSESAVMVSPAELDAEDSEFQAELLKSFLEGVHPTMTGLRKITQEFSKAQDE